MQVSKEHFVITSQLEVLVESIMLTSIGKKGSERTRHISRIMPSVIHYIDNIGAS